MVLATVAGSPNGSVASFLGTKSDHASVASSLGTKSDHARPVMRKVMHGQGDLKKKPARFLATVAAAEARVPVSSHPVTSAPDQL